MYYHTKEVAMANKYTSIVNHFYGHAYAWVHYSAHCLMENVQDFAGSHWTPPSGDCLLCIALAAAQVSFKTTTIKEYTNFAGHSNGHGNVPVLYLAHCPMEEVQGFTRSHWMPPLSKYPTWYHQLVIDMLILCCFSLSTCWKWACGDVKAPINCIGMTYQTEGKDLTNMTELFVGGVKIACYCLNKHFILPFI